MKHVSILALHDATMTSIDSSQQVLNRVNDFLKYQKKVDFYTVEIVGAKKLVKLNDGLYTISVNKTIDEVKKTDAIVIPLLCGNFSKALQENKKYCDWVISQYYKGAEIVCLCVGSFFLASTDCSKTKNVRYIGLLKMNLRQCSLTST